MYLHVHVYVIFKSNHYEIIHNYINAICPLVVAALAYVIPRA